MSLRNISPERLIVGFLIAGVGTGAFLAVTGISSVWGMRILVGTVAIYATVLGLLILTLIVLNNIESRRKGDD